MTGNEPTELGDAELTRRARPGITDAPYRWPVKFQGAEAVRHRCPRRSSDGTLERMTSNGHGNARWGWAASGSAGVSFSLLFAGCITLGCSATDDPAQAASPVTPMAGAPAIPVPGGANPGLTPGDGSGAMMPPPAAVPSDGPAPEQPPSSPGQTPVSSGASCSGGAALAPKRLVRLTFNQVANSIGALISEPLAAQLKDDFELSTDRDRTFPPLNNPREGSVIIDSSWQTSDGIAMAAARYVFEQFDSVTGCGDEPTEACAREYTHRFVAGAFRRPLDADEQARFDVVFDTALSEGASVAEATHYSVYAALSAPQFLYRSEFGEDSLADGLLSPYETASMLSYFLTDGPPDSQLLEAAAAGELQSAEQLTAQVERLLQSPLVQRNLESAIYAYFGLSTLRHINIDTGVAPQFTETLREAMMRESEWFIDHTLRTGTVEDLLGSRTSYVNQELADLYGVEFPPPGATLDEDGFAEVVLPENRAGILTQPGYLTTRSRPEEASVVGRGLLINASLLCAEAPPFPDQLAEEIEAVEATLHGMTEREKADYRAQDPLCNGCHAIFDPYGVALENFDIIGAYREHYEMEEDGEVHLVPIDASVTLPPPAGGATVNSAVEMAQELISTGAFVKCMSKNLLAYAMAEGSSVTTRSCVTLDVVEGFEASDRSLSSLAREVVKSPAFVQRSAGETP